MKPSWSRHRSDTGSADLVALFRAMGVGYVHLGGSIDGFAYYGNEVVLVDFKAGAKAKRTKNQIALVAEGVPIHFVASDLDVRHVVAWLKRAA